MKIGNISNNTSFKNIYTVVGDKKNMSKLRILIADEKKTSNNPAMVYNLTGIANIPTQTDNKAEGKQLCVVVTGEESLKATNTLAGSKLSSYLLLSADKLITLSNNVKNDALEIFEAIKNNK